MKKVALMMLVALCLGAGGVKAVDAPEAAAASKPAKPTRCEPATGSRLSSPPDANGRCNSGTAGFRSYDKEEIERTGEIDLDRALSKLDPSLSRR